MEVTFPHQVLFTNEAEISVQDVAHSLLANEQLVLSLGPVLEKCFPGLIVEKIRVDFRSATINSPLEEALSAGILITFQDDLKKEVPALIGALTGHHVDDKYSTIVTVLFLIVVVYGVRKAWDLLLGSKEKNARAAPGTIVNNYGTLVQAGADLLGVSPTVLESAVTESFPDKRLPHLTKSSLAFIRPAQREKGASIIGAGLRIGSDTIEAAPSALDFALEEEHEKQIPHQKAEVVIHATDIDHGASGWAGHLPGICDKRLRMKLFPSILPAQLFGKEKVIADIILVCKKQDNGEYQPYLFHVVNVY